MLHDMNQMLADQAAENINVVTSNLKGYAVKPATTTKSRDKCYVYVKPIGEGINYYTGKYPDYDNCRLFIRSENFGQVFDYSLMNNQTKVLSDVMIQEVVVREEPTNIVQAEFVSYFNGTHYVNVKDDRKLRLKDIIVDTPEKDGFCIIKRFNPLRYGNSKQDSIILTQKTDTSQNQYGYSLNLDHDGNLYFYVSFNYKLYYVVLENAIDPIYLGDVNFFFQNFNKRNFKTEYASVTEWAKIMYDVACSFDFSTKECKIRLKVKDRFGVEHTRSASSTTMLPSNLQIHMPLQEGKWSAVENEALDQVYDISTNGLIGTINNPDVSAEWQENNTLKNTRTATGGTYISIPNHTNINTLTEFTACFWVKQDSLVNADNSRYYTQKNWANNGSFSISRLSTGNTLSAQIKTDDGTLVFANHANAISDIENYHFVCVRWKSGEKIKVSINNNTPVESSGTLTGTITNTAVLTIYGVAANDATIINYMFFNKQLTALEQTSIYDLGAHLAQFPYNKEPQRTPSGDPLPITNPFAILYDLPKIPSPTAADYTFLNNPSADNPFVSKYNVAAGTPESITKVTPYNVPNGTAVTGSPYVLESELTSSDNSHGLLSSGTNDIIGVLVTSTSSGKGQQLYNKPFTKVGFWIKKNNTVGGTLYARIWNTNTGSVVANLGSMTNLNSTLTSSYAYYEFVNTSNTGKITGNDFLIGLEFVWSSSGQEISVQRVSGNVDSSIVQGTYDGDWSDNPSFEIAYRAYTGNGTSSTSPYYSMSYGNYKRFAQYIGTGDPMIGKAPTEATYRMYRESGTISGTLVWKIWKANGTIITLAASPLNATSITTSTSGAVYTFQDFENPNTLAAGDRIGIEWVSQPFLADKIFIMTNHGNNIGANNYNSTASYFTLYQSSWTTTTSAYDISGTLSYGGYTFSAVFKFSSTATRVGQRATNNSAPFWNQLLTKFVPKAKRTGTIPSPSALFCTIRRQSDNAVQKTIGSIDANSIGTASFGDIPPITNVGNNYIIGIGDYVCFELTSCDASNYIEFAINKDVANNTTMVQTISGVTSDQAQYELSGQFYIGGQIDESSRLRVGQYINNQNSLFMTTDNNQITYIEIPMYKFGSPTGQVFFNIRDENDTAVKTLGQIAASSLSTDPANPTIVPIEDLNNTYIIGAKNIITIEFDGGDQSNKVGVQVKTSTYDGTNSYLARYNGIDYDYDTSKKIVALMKTGGNTYTPDPSDLPPVMPQSDTDLYIGISGDKEGEYTIEIFDLFLFLTEIPTDDELLHFYENRNDMEGNAWNEILVTNHSFITLGEEE